MEDGLEPHEEIEAARRFYLKTIESEGDASSLTLENTHELRLRLLTVTREELSEDEPDVLLINQDGECIIDLYGDEGASESPPKAQEVAESPPSAPPSVSA